MDQDERLAFAGLLDSEHRAHALMLTVSARSGHRYPRLMTSLDSTTSSLGRESADDGSFRRQPSRFRGWVSDDGSSEFPLEAGRYHLYVARACPWAHRTIIGRRLMGLEDAIGISFADPLRDEHSWAFTGGEYTDAVNGNRFLAEAYAATDPSYDARVTVPVLWDRQTGAIVNNESADILRMLGTVFASARDPPSRPLPRAARGTTSTRSTPTSTTRVNNAVYKAGFATAPGDLRARGPQPFRDARRARRRLAERSLPVRRRAGGDRLRLFTTLVRFDAVYQIHFKCSLRKLIEYEHLWPYARDLYQWPGIAETAHFDEIRWHYYRTHPMLNPSGLVAVQPTASFETPPGRERLSA